MRTESALASNWKRRSLQCKHRKLCMHHDKFTMRLSISSTNASEQPPTISSTHTPPTQHSPTTDHRWCINNETIQSADTLIRSCSLGNRARNPQAHATPDCMPSKLQHRTRSQNMCVELCVGRLCKHVLNHTGSTNQRSLSNTSLAWHVSKVAAAPRSHGALQTCTLAPMRQAVLLHTHAALGCPKYVSKTCVMCYKRVAAFELNRRLAPAFHHSVVGARTGRQAHLVLSALCRTFA